MVRLRERRRTARARGDDEARREAHREENRRQRLRQRDRFERRMRNAADRRQLHEKIAVAAGFPAIIGRRGRLPMRTTLRVQRVRRRRSGHVGLRHRVMHRVHACVRRCARAPLRNRRRERHQQHGEQAKPGKAALRCAAADHDIKRGRKEPAVSRLREGIPANEPSPPPEQNRIPRCRFSGRPLKHTFVDLGMSPIANSNLRAQDLARPEKFYPLHVRVAEDSFLVQLEEFEGATAEDIFNPDYVYFSSYSDSWLQHARRYCEMMIQRFGIGPRPRGRNPKRAQSASEQRDGP